MNLSSPLGLLALGLTVPLVVWYLLRARRPRLTVASTFLWRQTDRSVAAAVPWQRFRPDLTFWLVLAGLVLGAVALADPFVEVPAELGDHTIVVVDVSGSMLADEEGPTRLELARRKAGSLVDRLGDGQVMSIVEAGTRSRVLVSASGDAPTLSSALSSLRPSHGPVNLGDAFTLVAALERPDQATVVHLLTDGIVPETAAASVPTGLAVTAVGTDRPNLALTRLQAVPVGAGTSQAFVQVKNFGPLPARALLTLSVGDDELVQQEVRLGPRGVHDDVLRVTGTEGDVLTAAVRPLADEPEAEDAADALAVDDQAFALLAAPRELEVLLATPGNVFLETALRSVPGLEVSVAGRVPPDLDGTDLLVVDRVAAPSTLDVPTLLVAPTAAPAGVELGAEVELPALTFQSPDHELLAEVDLSDVGIASATQVDAPTLTPVASSSDGPLILAGRLDNVPIVVVGFDLLSSNLPLRAAWPVFVSNTVGWLAGPSVPPPVTAGGTVTVPVPQGAERVAASPPSGDAVELDPAAPRFTADQVGVWEVTVTTSDGDTTSSVVVNPDPFESDLARARPAIEGSRDSAAPEAVAPTASGRRGLWRELLAVVLVLVLAEWLWTQAGRTWRRRRRHDEEATPELVGRGVRS